MDQDDYQVSLMKNDVLSRTYHSRLSDSMGLGPFIIFEQYYNYLSLR